MTMTESKAVVLVNDENFTDTIASGVTIVDFSAEWCGPCKMMGPVFEEVANAMVGKATFATIDIDENQNTTASYQVTAVPTLIVFKDGKEFSRATGLQNAESLTEMVEKAI